MVDDARWVAVVVAARLIPRLVSGCSLKVGEFGDVAPDVVAVRIEPQALGHGVEHAIERRCVGAAAGGPLPAVRIARDIAVAQPVHELGGTQLPPQMKVLDEEARDDHSHPVVHPPFSAQLAHAGIDERVAGAALSPGGERLVGVRTGVPAHAGIEARVQ